MITWITATLFQFMFGVTISGDALILIRVMGFVELLIELALIAFATGVYVWDKLEKRGDR